MSEDTTKLIDEELKEWQDSLDYVIQKDGIERAKKLLENLDIHAYQQNIRSWFTNSIHPTQILFL